MKRNLMRDFYQLSIDVQMRIVPEFFTQTSKRWAVITAAVIATLTLDYVTGPTVRFPILYVPPIFLVAWYDGFGKGAAVACVMLLARFSMRFLWGDEPWPLSVAIMNLVTNLTGTLFLAWFIARAGRLTREIRILKGFLRACRYCDKVRLDHTNWMPWENFLQEHSEALLINSVCPACSDRGLAKTKVDNN